MELAYSCPKFVIGAIAFMLVNYAIEVISAVPADSPDLITEEPFTPIPLELKLDSKKTALGEMLFQERELSGDESTSCADCHRLDQGGDGKPAKSITVMGATEIFDTPTVFNSYFNFRLTWLGSCRTLEQYIDLRLTGSQAGDSTWTRISANLAAQKKYSKAFSQIYSNGITKHNVLDALSEFVRSLFTPNSPFDRFLRGDNEALTTEEKQGYKAFMRYGCAACHQGINIGGNMFQKMGIFWSNDEGAANPKPLNTGRYLITGDERDRNVFRVPSLRNIALTAPYFHDGSVDSLQAAVRIMAKAELGRDIPDRDIQLIVTFLRTLTGNYHGRKLGQETK